MVYVYLSSDLGRREEQGEAVRTCRVAERRGLKTMTGFGYGYEGVFRGSLCDTNVGS